MASTSKVPCSLHESIKTFNLKLVQQAYKHDASSINTLDPAIGWSVLYKAVVYEQIEIAKYLLEKGADPNLPNKIGEAPLHYTVEIGKPEFVELLLKNGANPNLQQSDGNSAFHIACKKNFTDIIKLMLYYKVDVNLQNKLGKTPLHFVCSNGNSEIYEILLKEGANPNIKDKWGKKAQLPGATNTGEEATKEKIVKTTFQPQPLPLPQSQSQRQESNIVREIRKVKEEKSENKENIMNLNKTQPQNVLRRIEFNRTKPLVKKEEVMAGMSNVLETKADKDEKNIIPEKMLGDITNVVMAAPISQINGEICNEPVPEKPSQLIKQTGVENRATRREVINSLMSRKKVLKSPSQPQPQSRKEEAIDRSNQNKSLVALNTNSDSGSKYEEVRTEENEKHDSLSKLAKPIRSLEDSNATDNLSSKRSSADSSLEDNLTKTQDSKPYIPNHHESEVPVQPIADQPRRQNLGNILSKTKAEPFVSEFLTTDFKSNEKLQQPEIKQEKNSSETQIEKEVSAPCAPKDDQSNGDCQTINHTLTNIFCRQSPEKKKIFERPTVKSRSVTINSDEKIPGGPKMADWLAEIGLEELKLNFTDNGYVYQSKFRKDYEHSKTIFQDLIYRFGVDKLGHRSRITMKLREESGIFMRKGLFKFSKKDKKSNLNYPSVEEWLTSLGHGDCVENFLDNGFDNLEYIILQTSFKEFPFDEFLMRDELGIKHKKIRDDMLKRLRYIYEAAQQIDPEKFDSDMLVNLLCSRDQLKTCSMF